jgi:hypothetical protein
MLLSTYFLDSVELFRLSRVRHDVSFYYQQAIHKLSHQQTTHARKTAAVPWGQNDDVLVLSSDVNVLLKD